MDDLHPLLRSRPMVSVRTQLRFSELTLHPGGVSTRYEPKRVDVALGRLWRGVS